MATSSGACTSLTSVGRRRLGGFPEVVGFRRPNVVPTGHIPVTYTTRRRFGVTFPVSFEFVNYSRRRSVRLCPPRIPFFVVRSSSHIRDYEIMYVVVRTARYPYVIHFWTVVIFFL